MYTEYSENPRSRKELHAHRYSGYASQEDWGGGGDSMDVLRTGIAGLDLVVVLPSDCFCFSSTSYRGLSPFYFTRTRFPRYSTYYTTSTASYSQEYGVPTFLSTIFLSRARMKEDHSPCDGPHDAYEYYAPSLPFSLTLALSPSSSRTTKRERLSLDAVHSFFLLHLSDSRVHTNPRQRTVVTVMHTFHLPNPSFLCIGVSATWSKVYA